MSHFIKYALVCYIYTETNPCFKYNWKIQTYFDKFFVCYFNENNDKILKSAAALKPLINYYPKRWIYTLDRKFDAANFLNGTRYQSFKDSPYRIEKGKLVFWSWSRKKLVLQYEGKIWKN